MSALQQLDIVERYYEKYLGAREIPDEDYILVGYGRSDLVNKSDSVIVDRRDSASEAERKRYTANRWLDVANKGYITVGDIRAPLRRTIANAGGRRLPVPDIVIPTQGKRGSKLVGGILVLSALGLGALAWTRRRG